LRSDLLRVLTVGPRYPLGLAAEEERRWRALVAALRARGDAVRVLTTDEPGPEEEGVTRALRWHRAGDGWARPGRLEASRVGRHGLLALGEALQAFRPHAVVWVSMGGLPLTLVGASALPELALVYDEWPLYAPHVDPQTRRDGWDPGAVARWSVRSAPARERLLRALGDRVPAERVGVDSPGDGWATAVLAQLDALAAPA
jgi:hypothetical protein